MTEPSARDLARLSQRELEVFHLIGAGRGIRQIAEDLKLSEKTVASYRENIKRKLALPNGRAVLQRAIEWRVEEGLRRPAALS